MKRRWALWAAVLILTGACGGTYIQSRGMADPGPFSGGVTLILYGGNYF